MIIQPVKIAQSIIDNGLIEKVIVKQGVYDCSIVHTNKQIMSFRYDFSMNPRIERFMVFIDCEDLNFTVEESVMIRHLLIQKWDSKSWALIPSIERNK